MYALQNYLSGNELDALKADSGAKGIEKYNFGHLEPNDITVNTRTLGIYIVYFLIISHF